MGVADLALPISGFGIGVRTERNSDKTMTAYLMSIDEIGENEADRVFELLLTRVPNLLHRLVVEPEHLAGAPATQP
jgi:hypothetical protein